MHSLNSDKEFINGNNAVFGEFIDPPVTNNTNDTRSNNVPTMHYYFNSNLIQVFHNRSTNSVDNNINLNESSDLILEISLDDLERLAPVQQVNNIFIEMSEWEKKNQKPDSANIFYLFIY